MGRVLAGCFFPSGNSPNRMAFASKLSAQLLRRLPGVELRIVLRFFDQFVVAVHRRVALEHIENETFLYRLLHGVAVEGPVFDLAFGVGRLRVAEQLQRLALWRGGERKVAGVG